MLAASGLLIFLVMGYAVSGMVSDDDSDAPTDGPDFADDETETGETSESTSLADLLFGDEDNEDDGTPNRSTKRSGSTRRERGHSERQARRPRNDGHQHTLPFGQGEQRHRQPKEET